MTNFAFLLEGSNAGSGFLSIGLIVLMFVAMWFFLIRPQKKQEKKDAAMRDALQVGDEVTTIGGIIGKVISIKEETFVLETTKNRTRIRFLKGAIRTVDVRVADIAAQTIQEKVEAEKAEKTEATETVETVESAEASENKEAEVTEEKTNN